ncbi:MAG: AmmeMemoRadiSam system protein B [Kiloniellales bacterium]|nr:AmmeMemoRadiSam system protein B [Kiloniellales bacterium]
MSGLRAPAVAGSFYPGRPAALAAAVEGYLAAAAAPTADPAENPADAAAAADAVPKAVIVPHAGYVYSAPVAAAAYARLAPLAGRVRRVVLLGPAHTVHLDAVAAPRAAAFDGPLGALAVDRDALAGRDDLPQVVFDDRPHAREHALEVQLPFLQTVLGAVALVPLVVGEVAPDAVAQVIERLWGGRETLILVSTDLSHYRPYAAARARDAATARAIEALDGARIGPEDACGCRALAGLLAVARARGLKIARLDLRSSGDTAGPKDQVVGYGAWALYERERG